MTVVYSLVLLAMAFGCWFLAEMVRVQKLARARETRTVVFDTMSSTALPAQPAEEHYYGVYPEPDVNQHIQPGYWQ